MSVTVVHLRAGKRLPVSPAEEAQLPAGRCSTDLLQPWVPAAAAPVYKRTSILSLLPRSLSTACIAQVAGGATPTVSVVFDLGGEVAACVADVGLLEKALLPPLLQQPQIADALAAAPVLMLDGNLAEAALEVRGCSEGTQRRPETLPDQR